ncbi:MAG: PilZ domain-containing protein [Acidobacteriota bacterium]
MSISQRQHIRFSLEVPAILYRKNGEKLVTATQQISVGGCLTSWDDNFYPGDEFRFELELSNGNRLPLTCRVVYCFDASGIGAKFVDITKFEQSLIAKTISARLELDGLPMPIDAFEEPPKFEEVELKVSTVREQREEKLREVMVLDLDD